MIPINVLQQFLSMSSGGFSFWLVRQLIAALVLFLAVWAVAFSLARVRAFWGGDPVLRVDIGWLLPVMIVAVLLALESVVASLQFKRAGLGLLTLVPLTIDSMAVCGVGVSLTRRIGRRIETMRQVDQLRG